MCTYAEALNRQLPATHLSMLTRMQIKEKQVLIDKDLSAETNQLSDLTEFKLVAKANEASHTWPQHSCMAQPTPRQWVQSACEMVALSSSRAVQKPPVGKKRKRYVCEGFGATSVVRERAISVIAEYVPTSTALIHLWNAGRSNRTPGSDAPPQMDQFCKTGMVTIR